MECSVWRDAKNKTRGACAPRNRLAIRFSAREMLDTYSLLSRCGAEFAYARFANKA